MTRRPRDLVGERARDASQDRRRFLSGLNPYTRCAGTRVGQARIVRCSCWRRVATSDLIRRQGYRLYGEPSSAASALGWHAATVALMLTSAGWCGSDERLVYALPPADAGSGRNRRGVCARTLNPAADRTDCPSRGERCAHRKRPCWPDTNAGVDPPLLSLSGRTAGRLRWPSLVEEEIPFDWFERSTATVGGMRHIEPPRQPLHDRLTADLVDRHSGFPGLSMREPGTYPTWWKSASRDY